MFLMRFFFSDYVRCVDFFIRKEGSLVTGYDVFSYLDKAKKPGDDSGNNKAYMYIMSYLVNHKIVTPIKNGAVTSYRLGDNYLSGLKSADQELYEDVLAAQIYRWFVNTFKKDESISRDALKQQVFLSLKTFLALNKVSFEENVGEEIFRKTLARLSKNKRIYVNEDVVTSRCSVVPKEKGGDDMVILPKDGRKKKPNRVCKKDKSPSFFSLIKPLLEKDGIVLKKNGDTLSVFQEQKLVTKFGFKTMLANEIGG